MTDFQDTETAKLRIQTAAPAGLVVTMVDRAGAQHPYVVVGWLHEPEMMPVVVDRQDGTLWSMEALRKRFPAVRREVWGFGSPATFDVGRDRDGRISEVVEEI